MLSMYTTSSYKTLQLQDLQMAYRYIIIVFLLVLSIDNTFLRRKLSRPGYIFRQQDRARTSCLHSAGKPLSFALPAHLAAVQVGRTLHLRRGVSISAASAVIAAFKAFIPVKRFFAQYPPVQIHRLVQFLQVGLGCALHRRKLLLVLVCLRLDVR